MSLASVQESGPEKRFCRNSFCRNAPNRRQQTERGFAFQNCFSIENAVGVIEEKASQMADDYRERLFQKLTEILHDKNIDEQRV